MIPDWISTNLQWYVAGVIVVLGLLVFGLRDLSRFSFTRVWAISGVSFDESIRRRVLWLTPLAILGVIIVSQLQNATDEQDAINQTVKFCVFATGLVLVITTIILACTNLPKEIDNRVIFTIVTKPTTRLEIILGKILGFARVSAAILLIMGVFSYAYVSVRAYALQKDIAARPVEAMDAVNAPVIEHYKKVGLLYTRDIDNGSSLKFLARVPDPKSEYNWIVGGGTEQSVVVPFEFKAEDLRPADDANADAGSTGLNIVAKVKYSPALDPRDNPTGVDPNDIPTPLLASTRPSLLNDLISTEPVMTVEILTEGGEPLVGTAQMGDGKPALIPSNGAPLEIKISPEIVKQTLLSSGRKNIRCIVRLTGLASNIDYGIHSDPVTLVVPPASPGAASRVITAMADRDQPENVIPAAFQGRQGSDGFQVRGSKTDRGPLAAVHFDNAKFATDASGNVPIEVKVAVERGGSDEDEELDEDRPTQVQFQTLNYTTGKLGTPVTITPESRRLAYVNIPAAELQGGKFDLLIRCASPGHWVTLSPTSVGLVASSDSFLINLFKSFVILWMLSILVITISIFCSTWLSWPIAFVLTLVILLGHWGVTQLGDSITSGVGHDVVNTWFPKSTPREAKVISSSIETLTGLLNTMAKILPDVEQFPATQDIEKGISIPFSRLIEGLKVLGAFGVPLAVLAYLILKNKEVAP